jgi:hypothetical protein
MPGGGNIYRPFSNVHRCFLSFTQLYSVLLCFSFADPCVTWTAAL